ncbi:glycine cleavage system protein GcvH [Synechococcales cyanobacterium C]|uniref:Glycine cleavage system H protein n=1 Tax=Petrachloros mirabilis ULC683 TaxID=2781853 RepID=A0A8K1ZZY8_9CYAN|nr:glycine cleavage system protein GcvH [Petrachloros mirabilis]NCJ07216.1 glycine cleavage system protein GcvH [Petrachloros mirabilis ULC683]
MSFEYPEDLRYLDSHEYVRLEGEIATLGISAFALDQLGDIVFVDLPSEGDVVTQGEVFGNIESVKAVEDLYSPVTGTVVEVNTPLADNPEQLVEDPYGEGWLLKVRVAESLSLDDTLSATEYQLQVDGE